MKVRLGSALCLVLGAVVLGAGALRAETEAVDAALCERAILQGARGGGVPTEVLHAVSLTETGRLVGGRLRPYPWAINREGESFWFGSRAAAIAFARRSIAEGRPSFDVGCFQINYRWHGDRFPSLDAMFEPEVGAAYAAQFLRSLHAERGDWSAAAGAYHSQTPEFAHIYRARFDRIFASLGGAPLVVAEAAPAVEGKPATPRRSRTRMARGPKIITIPKPGARAPVQTEAALTGGAGPSEALPAGAAGTWRAAVGTPI